MRTSARITLAAGLGFLAAGCAESTWVWTLNPDGTGKVELDALMQPTFDVFGSSRSESGPFEDDPDGLAGKTAVNILARSKGVAAWKGVSSGIAEDGRVIFKGTAYFPDLAEVRITGDPFPTSFVKPKLSEDEDDRLVLGLQFGGADEGRDEDDEPGDSEAEEEPTQEEVAQGVRKAKVAYQTVKPIASAFLSTMRTEIVVRLPGEATEVSNFERREDGALRLVFDGPTLLATLDELAEKDVAKWYEFAVKLKEEKRPDEEALWLLNELTFGERGPVRAVVAGEVKPLFDYEAELAKAIAEHHDFYEERRMEAKKGGHPFGDFMGYSGAVVASARTDSGTGLGWEVSLTGGDRGGPFFWEFAVSRVEHEKDSPPRDLMRIIVSAGDSAAGWQRVGAGVALSFGEGDIWGIGPRALYDVGFFGRRVEFYLRGSVYLWLGERDDAFDADVEADARIVVGLRF
jgi:hypothetical protein